MGRARRARHGVTSREASFTRAPPRQLAGHASEHHRGALDDVVSGKAHQVQARVAYRDVLLVVVVERGRAAVKLVAVDLDHQPFFAPEEVEFPAPERLIDFRLR
jgi:hypothetical protein